MKITLIIEGDAERFADKAVIEKLNSLLVLVSSPEDVEPIDVRAGSINVTMNLIIDPTVNCVHALANHQLSDLGIRAVVVHDEYIGYGIASEEDLVNFYYSQIAEYNKAKADSGDATLSANDIAAQTSHLFEKHRPLAPFRGFPLLHAIVTLLQSGKLDIEIVSDGQWLLKPTVPAALHAISEVVHS